MNWHKFHVRDYLVATHHLADAEDLAYRRMIDLYYLTERPLQGPASVIAQKINLDVDCVEPVLKEFFREYEGRYVHDDIEEALSRRRRQLAACSAAGKIGGKRPKPKGKRSASVEKDLIVRVGHITVS